MGVWQNTRATLAVPKSYPALDASVMGEGFCSFPLEVASSGEALRASLLSEPLMSLVRANSDENEGTEEQQMSMDGGFAGAVVS